MSFSSVKSLDGLGHEGDMRVDSADLLPVSSAGGLLRAVLTWVGKSTI